MTCGGIALSSASRTMTPLASFASTRSPADCSIPNRNPCAAGAPFDAPHPDRRSPCYRPSPSEAESGERDGRNLIQQADRSEIPATMSCWGASRCQPIGVPGRYSLINAMANASESTPAQWAILARSGNKDSGSGPAATSIGRLAEERDSPSRHNCRASRTPKIRRRPSRRGGLADRARDEVLAILEAQREIELEEPGRLRRDSSVSHAGSRFPVAI